MIPLLTSLVRFADACTGQTLLPDLYAGGLRDTATCEVKIDSLSDIVTLIGNAIQILMFIAAFVAIAFIIIGGFTYMTSSGDAAGIKKAKETIVNAIIGLILAMVSFGVVRFITGSF